MSARTGAEHVRDTINNADEAKLEPPRPLIRELPPADPFPVNALGKHLEWAARATHNRVQAPSAICGQSTLAAATLTVQAHANVWLPMGHEKPISSYFVSVAATGERKTAVDHEALWPLRKREAALREVSASERLEYENAEKGSRSSRKESKRRSRPNQASARRSRSGAGSAA
jgi:hypothetical protein